MKLLSSENLFALEHQLLEDYCYFICHTVEFYSYYSVHAEEYFMPDHTFHVKFLLIYEISFILLTTLFKYWARFFPLCQLVWSTVSLSMELHECISCFSEHTFMLNDPSCKKNITKGLCDFHWL